MKLGLLAFIRGRHTWARKNYTACLLVVVAVEEADDAELPVQPDSVAVVGGAVGITKATIQNPILLCRSRSQVVVAGGAAVTTDNTNGNTGSQGLSSTITIVSNSQILLVLVAVMLDKAAPIQQAQRAVEELAVQTWAQRVAVR